MSVHTFKKEIIVRYKFFVPNYGYGVASGDFYKALLQADTEYRKVNRIDPESLDVPEDAMRINGDDTGITITFDAIRGEEQIYGKDGA